MDNEALLDSFYRGILKPGAVVIDVGAHMGRHLFPMHQCVGDDGMVIGIEAMPLLAGTLKQMLAEMKPAPFNIHLVEAAAARRRGRAQFTIARDEYAYSGLRKRSDCPGETEVIEVRTVTLDDVAVRLPRVDFVKLDVEGAEFEALRGFTRGLRRFRPIVSFECGLPTLETYDLTADWIYSFWQQLDYRLEDLTRRPVESPEALHAAIVGGEVWDFLAFPLPLSLGRRAQFAVANIAETLGASRSA